MDWTGSYGWLEGREDAGQSAGGFWAGFDAIGMSVEFTAGVLIDHLFEETKFALGPTIVVRKDSIAKIGGFAGVREYLSNDFVVGNFIYKAGYLVVLSGYVVDHVCSSRTFRPMWERQLRWAMGTRYSRPAGHLGSGLTFAVPFGILGLAAGWMLGRPWLGIGLFAASLLNRMLECWLIGWWTSRPHGPPLGAPVPASRPLWVCRLVRQLRETTLLVARYKLSLARGRQVGCDTGRWLCPGSGVGPVGPARGRTFLELHRQPCEEYVARFNFNPLNGCRLAIHSEI